MSVSRLVIEVKGKPFGYRIASLAYKYLRYSGLGHDSSARLARCFMVARISVAGRTTWHWLGGV